jgi:hypothetical protein
MRQGKSLVFVRQATGFRKNVSLTDAISINVSDMSAGAALAVVGYTTILMPWLAVDAISIKQSVSSRG